MRKIRHQILDLADPSTDVEELYKKFKRYIIKKHVENNHPSVLNSVIFRYHQKPSSIEFHDTIFQEWLMQRWHTYISEHLLGTWCRAGFIKQIGKNSYRCLR
jgi:hypothetical protein